MSELSFGQTEVTMTQIPRQLEALSSEGFIDRFVQIGTIEGLYCTIRRSREVRTLHAAMREGVVKEADLDEYVRMLLRSFVGGEQFRYQISIAAIAVACVGINKAYARNFVVYLATLRSVEMHLATQIAHHALQVIPTTIRKTISTNSLVPDVQYVKSVPRSDAGQTTLIIERELVNA
jgi:hypothetical protein